MTIFRVTYNQRTSPQIHSDCVLCAASDLDESVIRDILAALTAKTGLPVSDIHISGVDRLNEVLEVPNGQAQSDRTDPVPAPGPAASRTSGGEPAAKPESVRSGSQSGSNRRSSGR